MNALRARYDVVVIGAGPAGLAAATVAAEHGLDTVLLDEQSAVGGQIYRAVTETPVRDPDVLGADYWRGGALVETFRNSGAQHMPGAVVWSVAPTDVEIGAVEIGVSVDGAAQLLEARHVVIATGALERPMPIPGWTLPGVMTVGAAQILLKSSGLVADGRVVLAGSGPLLWLFARQHLAAGGTIAALLDTTPPENRWRAAPHLPAFLASPYAGKGLALVAAVRRRLPVIGNVTALRADGAGRLETVSYRCGDGAERQLDADLLLLHHGVVPNLNLALAAGCRAAWDAAQACFRIAADGWGASDVKGIAIAGDGAGIAGAEAAEQRGRLAALDVAHRLGRLDRAQRDRAAAPHRRALARWMRGRAFLDRLYQPGKSFQLPEGDTLVCRCEEVTARQIHDALALGVTGPNQLKAFLRCGMGPCQGRLCGPTVTALIAEARGVSPAEIGYYRLRPPVKPVTLGELAALPTSDAANKAVARG